MAIHQEKYLFISVLVKDRKARASTDRKARASRDRKARLSVLSVPERQEGQVICFISACETIGNRLDHILTAYLSNFLLV